MEQVNLESTYQMIKIGELIRVVRFALRPFQFCNLCEVNVSDVDTQEELNARVKAAAFVETLHVITRTQ